MTYFESLKNAKSIREIFTERPDKYNQALIIAQDVLREPSHLPAVDKELIAAYTSYLNNCEYCFGSHKEFAISLGATEEDLLFSNPEHRLEALFEYVKILTYSPSLLTEDNVKAVVAAGFTEEELKDAIAVCALFNFYNRIIEGHGIDAFEESYKMSAEMINKHGYDGRY